jgi:hypothetical protein
VVALAKQPEVVVVLVAVLVMTIKRNRVQRLPLK